MERPNRIENYVFLQKENHKYKAIRNRLLKIDLTDLISTFLPQIERVKIKTTIEKLENTKLKLGNEDFVFV